MGDAREAAWQATIGEGFAAAWSRRDLFDEGFDAGVTEGIRQAREAVRWRFDYEANGGQDGNISYSAGFLNALDAIDALVANE